MGNWEEVHEAAKKYITDLEEMKVLLRDRAVDEIKARREAEAEIDAWRFAYELARRQ
jgi:hypothetical protein